MGCASSSSTSSDNAGPDVGARDAKVSQTADMTSTSAYGGRTAAQVGEADRISFGATSAPATGVTNTPASTPRADHTTSDLLLRRMSDRSSMLSLRGPQRSFATGSEVGANPELSAAASSSSGVAVVPPVPRAGTSPATLLPTRRRRYDDISPPGLGSGAGLAARPLVDPQRARRRHEAQRTLLMYVFPTEHPRPTTAADAVASLPGTVEPAMAVSSPPLLEYRSDSPSSLEGDGEEGMCVLPPPQLTRFEMAPSIAAAAEEPPPPCESHSLVRSMALLSAP